MMVAPAASSPLDPLDHDLDYSTRVVEFPVAALNKKLTIPLPGTPALTEPSLATVTVVSLISCVLSVYQALTLGFSSVLPVRLMPNVCALVPVLIA